MSDETRGVRFVQAQDVGVAINPMAVEGQIDGGVIQGIGRAILEEVVLKDGNIVNPSLTTYLMPMAADVPAVENILVQVPTEDGPFGARRRTGGIVVRVRGGTRRFPSWHTHAACLGA